jgi:hypothetical protein
LSRLLLFFCEEGSCPDSHKGGATGLGAAVTVLAAGFTGGGAGAGTTLSSLCLLVADSIWANFI